MESRAALSHRHSRLWLISSHSTLGTRLSVSTAQYPNHIIHTSHTPLPPPSGGRQNRTWLILWSLVTTTGESCRVSSRLKHLISTRGKRCTHHHWIVTDVCPGRGNVNTMWSVWPPALHCVVRAAAARAPHYTQHTAGGGSLEKHVQQPSTISQWVQITALLSTCYLSRVLVLASNH